MNPAQATIIPAESPAFARTLQVAGASRWQDAALPYRLAGAGAVLRLEGSDGAGVVGMTIRPGYLRQEPVSIAVLRDLAVEPAARGKGMGRALVAAAIAEARARGARIAVFGSIGPYLPITSLDRAGGEFPAFHRVASLVTTRIVPALGRWEEPEYKISKASNQDAPALAYLLDRYRRQLAFAPVTDEATFREGVSRCPGLAVTDFRIARYKDEMVAMVGVWEPGPALPVLMPVPSMAERLVGGTSRLLGPLSRLPRLPNAGEPLRVRFLRALACKRDHGAAFRYLVDRVANEARKAGAHAVEFTLLEGEPMLEGIRGRVRRTWKHSVWAAPLTAEVSLDDLGPVDPGVLDPGPEG